MRADQVLPQEQQQQKASIGERVLKSIFDPKQYATLGGEFRRGLKDVQDTVLQAFPDSTKSRDEPGTIGNPTPQIVTGQITGKGVDLDMGR